MEQPLDRSDVSACQDAPGRRASEPLSFDVVWQCLHPGRRFVGPRNAERDYRLVAGILFCRWNDRSVRRLVVWPGEYPYADVAWYRDFSGCVGTARVHVHPDVVELLRRERFVREAEDPEHLVLTQRANMYVVTEWFDSGPMDPFSGGAILNVDTGHVRWPRDAR